MYTDSEGYFLDIIWDAICVLWSGIEFIVNPTEENFQYLLMDLAALGIPFVPAMSGGLRIVKNVDKTIDAGKTANKVIFVGKAANKVDIVAPTKITGFTSHGTHSAISHNGRGVNQRAILDAVKKPTKLGYDSVRDTFKYVGRDAVVVLNKEGKIVTTWATNRNGFRLLY